MRVLRRRIHRRLGEVTLAAPLFGAPIDPGWMSAEQQRMMVDSFKAPNTLDPLVYDISGDNPWGANAQNGWSGAPADMLTHEIYGITPEGYVGRNTSDYYTFDAPQSWRLIPYPVKLQNGNVGFIKQTGQVVDSGFVWKEHLGDSFLSIVAIFGAMIAGGALVAAYMAPAAEAAGAAIAAAPAGDMFPAALAPVASEAPVVAAQTVTQAVATGSLSMSENALSLAYGIESGSTLPEMTTMMASQGVAATDIANAVVELNAATQGALLQGATLTTFNPDGTYTLSNGATSGTPRPPTPGAPSSPPGSPSAVDAATLARTALPAATGLLPTLTRLLTGKNPPGYVAPTTPGNYSASSGGSLLLIGAVALLALGFMKSSDSKKGH